MPRDPGKRAKSHQEKTGALALFDTLVYTCHYRLVIEPAGNVMARVLDWRRELRERIGKFNEAYEMPGIVLFSTELPPEYEGHLSEPVLRGCAGFPPFALNLTGPVHSEDRKSIYLDMLERGTVAALRQRVTDHVRTNRRIKKLGVEVTEHARLCIASGLKPDQFAAAWAMLATQAFGTQQRVSDVVLLKRELAPDSLDAHVRTFPLILAH